MGQLFPSIPRTLIIASDDLEELKLLLALINTPLALFYIREKYPSSTYNGGITFTKEMLNDLPIPKISKNNRTKLIAIVDQILNAKMDDFGADTRAIEGNLSDLVFDLYELAPQERELVNRRQ